MIALKSQKIKIFMIFSEFGYNYLNDLNFTNSIGNNFFMMLTTDFIFYSNLFTNCSFESWSKFINTLHQKILNEYIKINNFKQVNIFGDNCWTLFIKNYKLHLNKYNYLSYLKKQISNKNIYIDDLNLEHQDKEGNNIIHLILNNNRDLQHFFVDFLYNNDLIHILGTPNNDNITPLMLMFKNNLLKSFNYTYSYLDYLNIDQLDKYGNNCLFYLNNNHNYSKKHKLYLTNIYTKINKFNIINNNNESLFVKLIKSPGLFDIALLALRNKKDFSVFDYIDKKYNISTLMLFIANFYQHSNNLIENKELLNNIIDYENNHILHKDNEGFNVFIFAFRLNDFNLKIKILKRLNYDIELYKSMKLKHLNLYNKILLYTSNFNYDFDNNYPGILTQLSSSRGSEDLLIYEIFNNIPNINYKYQDEKLKKTNDTYLTYSLSSKKNKVFVHELFKLCKDDYEYINHTSNKNFNFIISSIEYGYNEYLENIIRHNIQIDKKYYELINNKKSLLITAIYNCDINIAHYLIFNSPLNKDDLKKYIAHIVYEDITKKLPTSAFIEFMLSKLLYDGNLSKTKNSQVFAEILNMGIFDLRENMIIFEKFILNNKLKLKNTRIKADILETYKKGFEVVFNKYKKDVSNKIKYYSNILNITSDLNNSIFNIVFDIN